MKKPFSHCYLSLLISLISLGWSGLRSSCKRKLAYEEQAVNIANVYGCPVTPKSKMIRCLKSADPKTLTETANNPEIFDTLEGAWSPVIDGEFVTDTPYKLFTDGVTEGINILHGSALQEKEKCVFPLNPK